VSNELAGKRVAFLVANEGIEQVELTEPWKALQEAGARPSLVAPDSGKAQAFNHLDKADSFDVDVAVDKAAVDDYDLLVLPGGVANPDQLRTRAGAVAFVKGFFEAGKPVGVMGGRSGRCRRRGSQHPHLEP
jgi:protease I